MNANLQINTNIQVNLDHYDLGSAIIKGFKRTRAKNFNLSLEESRHLENSVVSHHFNSRNGEERNKLFTIPQLKKSKLKRKMRAKNKYNHSVSHQQDPINKINLKI